MLFCGSDVAQALGYSRSADAVRGHTKGSVKHRTLTNGGMQSILFIPESDVYRLIMRSKLSTAEQFEKWVVEVVLPSIRKHGAYIMPVTLDEVVANPDSAARLFDQLKQQEQQLNQMQPKADYNDALVNSHVLCNIRNTAKEFKLPEKLFVFLLEDMGLAYRTPQKQLMPYAFMVKQGYVELKEFTHNGHGGVQMLFTLKGRLYLMIRIQKHLARKQVEKFEDI